MKLKTSYTIKSYTVSKSKEYFRPSITLKQVLNYLVITDYRVSPFVDYNNKLTYTISREVNHEGDADDNNIFHNPPSLLRPDFGFVEFLFFIHCIHFCIVNFRNIVHLYHRFPNIFSIKDDTLISWYMAHRLVTKKQNIMYFTCSYLIYEN